jgi:hypothetical protein
VVWDEYHGSLADPAGPRRWAIERAEAGLSFIAHRQTVLVGKSIASLAAGVAADNRLPAIWYTPLLTDPEVVAQLRATPAPKLLVGGNADQWWDSQVAHSLGAEVVELARVDHGLEIENDPVASAHVLVTVAEATMLFLAGLQPWPSDQ